MATSRTGTAKWLRIRRQAIKQAINNNIFNCPTCGVGLDYEHSRQPNSAEVDHILPHSRGGEDSRKHANHLSLVQPAQGQRGPTPQTDGAETAKTTNHDSMVDSWCRTEARVPVPQRSGRPGISNRPTIEAAPTPQGVAGRPDSTSHPRHSEVFSAVFRRWLTWGFA